MTATNHYRDQIQRATERLAQLQAKELLANQRREAKAQETAKRDEIKRRQRVADLVFFAGAQTLDDAELVGALLEHTARRNDQNMRELIHAKGSERLKRH
ncbi:MULTISPECIES: conjugal transfer protein TraD [Xanthomonas]|uniref:Conjugal transfer protein TraD n=1 Tax=Xanthomonas euroxanthea TaxID=2259622 RepID=A0AA46HA97_9XANT|nr:MULTISPECIES: conjugal transfer protein TraD [Xanthomonas]MCD0251213.1 conjugal transfer protein TraD [Xanthomonas campestris pv. campestris]MCD0260697.1 conjugal transfer protein TraD [Xanthomonas campestris pv. campestris]MCD0268996.1 conjugal transfer protein TraD [Xanthomonas campestris pv. campestris]MCD0275326.1 conjugal transfer protein TraD [Xanthomonas campestris pv. campestris]MCF8790182.1 conjugal transfer protein TraD [Xanthomonas campestris pv. campestris]